MKSKGVGSNDRFEQHTLAYSNLLGANEDPQFISMTETPKYLPGTKSVPNGTHHPPNSEGTSPKLALATERALIKYRKRPYTDRSR